MQPQLTSLSNFHRKYGNISFPLVKLTSVAVTCLVLSPFCRPYWLKNRTVGRSRRHSVDFVTTAGDANPSHFSSRIAKVRSCDLHLCSISLQMCPPSSKIDRSRSLVYPKSLSSAKNTRTSVLPKRDSCLSKVTVAGFHSDEVQKSHFAAPLVLAKQYLLPNGSHLRAEKCPS